MSCSDSSDRLPDFRRGDTYAFELESSDPRTGAAIDITGYEYTITFKVNNDDADVDAVIQKTIVASGTDAENGIVEIRLESDETNVAVGTYYMDVQRVIPGSPPDVSTLVTQTIDITQDITITA